MNAQRQRPPTLRELLIEAVSPAQLTGLARDHFTVVYRTFARGTDHPTMALELVDHCDRHGAQARQKLIDELRLLNPEAVKEWERSLAAEADSSLDWPRRARAALLAPEEIEKITEAARTTRQQALAFCEQLDDNEWWNETPVDATHTRDQRRLRSELVLQTTQVLAAADYLLTIESADLTGSSGDLPPPELAAVAVADQQKRLVYNARTLLAQRLRELWYALRAARP